RKRMWEHEGIEESVMDVIVVDTVERIQGQERSLILISLTSSDTEHLKRSADFYFQPNRLNVALTRAKERVVVLGSRYMFDTKPDDLKHQQWLSYFHDFYLYCCRITKID
ncbi:MAG: AAA domain-containing protein, partial [Tannerellaceae bacterium]